MSLRRGRSLDYDPVVIEETANRQDILCTWFSSDSQQAAFVVIHIIDCWINGLLSPARDVSRDTFWTDPSTVSTEFVILIDKLFTKVSSDDMENLWTAHILPYLPSHDKKTGDRIDSDTVLALVLHYLTRFQQVDPTILYEHYLTGPYTFDVDMKPIVIHAYRVVFSMEEFTPNRDDIQARSIDLFINYAAFYKIGTRKKLIFRVRRATFYKLFVKYAEPQGGSIFDEGSAILPSAETFLADGTSTDESEYNDSIP